MSNKTLLKEKRKRKKTYQSKNIKFINLQNNVKPSIQIIYFSQNKLFFFQTTNFFIQKPYHLPTIHITFKSSGRGFEARLSLYEN